MALPMAPPMIRPSDTASKRLVAPRASHTHRATVAANPNTASMIWPA